MVQQVQQLLMVETQYLLLFRVQVEGQVHRHTQPLVTMEVREVAGAQLTQSVVRVYMDKVSKVVMHLQRTKVVVIQRPVAAVVWGVAWAAPVAPMAQDLLARNRPRVRL